MSNQRDTALKYAEGHKKRFLDELISYLRIPSVSTQPKHKEDLLKAAEWTAEAMRSAGLEHVEVIPSPVGRHPLVYADWLHAGPDAPTVLIYGHFDVQPPEPLELWDSPPFEPTVRDDYLYARGSTDDKGQAFIHIKMVESYLKTSGSIPVNVKFIYEGEEENGGVTLSAFIPENKEKLAADIALISDTGILSPTQPSLVYGLRGIHYDFIDLLGPNHDLHSGSFGGAINNPLNALGHIIAGLKDVNGRVLIPGFYDDVRELTAEERTLLNKLPIDEPTLLNMTGAPAIWGESEFTFIERLGSRPTLDVHGIIGGYTGEGGKTVLPSTAHAKISMRLVPDQDPEKIKQAFRAHVRTLVPESISVKFRDDTHGSHPIVIDYNLPAIKAAREAYAAVFENEPVLMREGGSIPVVNEFKSVLDLDTVLMGFGLPNSRVHSPNENFYLPLFERGIATAIHFIANLARTPKL
ncbi:MAG: dipeptidase [Ardenticatenaceae bacterium]|nr:dipeptidase [Ardenticatenaceae bacterium]